MRLLQEKLIGQEAFDALGETSPSRLAQALGYRVAFASDDEDAMWTALTRRTALIVRRSRIGTEVPELVTDDSDHRAAGETS